jgi:hypothetical protein
VDWAPLLSAIVGGAAALVGVVLSQRSERRKAHADRVWQKRSAIYLAAYRWAEVEGSRALMVKVQAIQTALLSGQWNGIRRQIRRQKLV